MLFTFGNAVQFTKNREQERTILMKRSARYLLTLVVAMGTTFAAVSLARAETCTLEIKRLESRTSFSPSDYIYRATMPQSFNAQIGPEGKSRISFGGQEDMTASFKRIVKQEPKYESEHPFRGVAKFGSQEYAFVLDEAIPESEKKKAEAEEKDAKAQTEDAKSDAKETKSDSALAKLKDSLLQALSPSDQEKTGKQIKAIVFNRLYFDFNRNGDLTDDKVIEAEQMPGRIPMSSSSIYSQFQFPRVDITIDADGTPLDYAFFLRGYVNSSRDFSYAGIQINSAAYREGDITLDGKKRHLVLIDFNSNGRFDDEIKISDTIRRSGGQLYPQQGDMLLVDPDQAGSRGFTSPYEATSNTYQHYVSKMVDIDGSYYDLKISPAGDKLTLIPASVTLGKVTNPNDRFSAVIYGDNGFLKISGNKDTPISIPAGEWKLLSYTIDLTNAPEPSKPAEKKEESKKSSGLEALGKALESVLYGAAPSSPFGRRNSHVTAQATAKYTPIKVLEGQTVELSFGPPYKPVVTVDYIQGGNNNKQAQLGMSLTGSAGEVVSDMMVNGGRPSKPEFTIKDSKGEIVQNGSFEYG